MIENRKIRVAITQGDSNGVGFEMIFKTFSEPEMLELCTPIIYGSPKIASYHNKALNVNPEKEPLHCPYSIINKVEDAHEDKVNLLVCFDEDLKVEFGKCTPASAVPAMKAMDVAVDDCKKGLVDVLVCGPVERRNVQAGDEQVNIGDYINFLTDKDDRLLRLYQNEKIRFAVASTGSISNVLAGINEENITSKLRSMCAVLKRDFRIDNPRIAVLALNPGDESEENALLATIVQTLYADDIQVFGPYKSDRFFPRREFEAFDAVLAIYPEQALLPMMMLSDSPAVVVQSGLPFVCTAPYCDARLPLAGRGLADEAPLRAAIYAGLDIFAARKDYDEAHANPLKKLYKERSDSGEKPYFVPPRRFDKTEKAENNKTEQTENTEKTEKSEPTDNSDGQQ